MLGRAANVLLVAGTIQTGHDSNRGCHLCITYPEILDMQVTAIIQAAINVAKKGIKVLPEIMIPLTIDKKELQIQVDQARALADGLIKAAKAKGVKYMLGTMIEIPRAALLADKIAEVAEFFNFGTNDLKTDDRRLCPRAQYPHDGMEPPSTARR